MFALIATLAIQALVSMAVLTPPVFAAVAAPEIGVSASAIGIYTSLIYAAACVAAAASGGPIRRRGAIRLSQICLVLCAAGLGLTATAHLTLVLMGAVLIGVGYGPVTPASSHLLIRQTPPHRRSLVFSLKQTGVPLGGALAGIAVPAFVLAVGWRGAALASALFCLLLAALVEPLHRSLDTDADPEARGERGILTAIRLVLDVPPLRRLALASLAFSAIQLCFSAYVVTFLNERIGLALVAAGAIMAAAQVAGIAARILWGWVADRFVAARALLLALGLAMGVAGAATGFITPGWPVAAIVAVTMLLGASALGWNGVYLAEVAHLAPAGAAGAATGGALSLTFLGVVIGPPLFGAVVAASGSYRPAFLAAALTAASAALILRRR
ncbi:MAG TPA: MFS transporter [Stellaceae bacterium]|nr:MFS transporter [Stellaceae bacterium]